MKFSGDLPKGRAEGISPEQANLRMKITGPETDKTLKSESTDGATPEAGESLRLRNRADGGFCCVFGLFLFFLEALNGKQKHLSCHYQ